MRIRYNSQPHSQLLKFEFIGNFQLIENPINS